MPERKINTHVRLTKKQRDFLIKRNENLSEAIRTLIDKEIEKEDLWNGPN